MGCVSIGFRVLGKQLMYAFLFSKVMCIISHV